MRDFTIMLPETIAWQRQVTDAINAIVSPIVQAKYGMATGGTATGSSYRGTNIGGGLDVDLFFVQVPHEPAQGFYDWTNVDTYGEGSGSGITDLTEVRTTDPVLAEVISASRDQLASLGENCVWSWVRTGDHMAGVIYRCSLLHPQCGTVDIDMTLSYTATEFGVGHTQRFQQYYERVKNETDEGRALQLLMDIRRLKWYLSTAVGETHEADKRQKVPGFLTEAFFTSAAAPRTFREVVTFIRSHTWPADAPPHLDQTIANETKQLIDTDASLDDLLRLTTQGGYAHLQAIARNLV